MFMLRTALLSGLISLLGAVPAAWGQTPAPEVRAMWVSRFEWPNANQATAKANIDNIMTTLAANNFNTVFFQVRGQCDVHYPSPYEPWSNTYNWTNPGWDPLAYAIQAAHSRGLEFHAYINTHTLAGPVPPANTTPQHKYNLHGPNVPAAQSWMIRTSPTAPAGAVDSYYWISPGVPEASWWTRQAVLHVVRNYNVDGVHFDRIRCPANTYSHDPVSEARFAGDGNPDRLAWADFMRSQITRDLRNIYGEIMLHKPHVKVSCSPFGIIYKDATTLYQGTGTQAYHSWFQDAWGWMRAHTVDFCVPMIYWEIGSAHPFELLLADWMARASGRMVVAGSTTNDGTKLVSALVAEQLEARRQAAAGHCVFSYGSMGKIPSGSTTNYWAGMKTNCYDKPTTVPEMPWKSSPTKGYLVGRVRDLQGRAVLDAKINLDGDPYNYLSAYDGFFAILDVAPSSSLRLTASKAGVGSATRAGISVGAGGVVQVDLVLASPKGQLTLDKAVYRENDTVKVSLMDGDLQGQPSVAVRLSSGSEPAGELVTLNQVSPGAFSGAIPLGFPPAASDDGTLQAADADTLSAYYRDANDGTGKAVDVLTTASVDYSPP